MDNKISVVGDIILDNYIRGKITRLNPEESGSPLVTVSDLKENITYKLGGAANVAVNIASLHGSASLIGVHGNDIYRSLLKKICKEYAVDLYSVLWDAPTIVKQRIMSGERQITRVDFEEIKQLTKKQIHNLMNLLSKENSGYIVVSDYNKGVISEQSTKLLMDMFSSENILVDAKPDNYHLFNGAYLIKSNFDEFIKVIGEKNIAKSDDQIIAQKGIELSKKMNANIVVTRSEYGATLIHKTGEVEHIPTEAREVFDVTGAGDTFLAALVSGLAEGMSLSEAVRYGNKASAVVVGKVGTAVVKKQEIM